MSKKLDPDLTRYPDMPMQLLSPFFSPSNSQSVCSIMAYSKDDFFHWDMDIYLDLLLGEYTNSEFEIDLSFEEVVTAEKLRNSI